MSCVNSPIVDGMVPMIKDIPVPISLIYLARSRKQHDFCIKHHIPTFPYRHESFAIHSVYYLWDPGLWIMGPAKETTTVVGLHYYIYLTYWSMALAYIHRW